MRLTVPQSFWRSNCSALIFSFIDSNVSKLNNRFPKQLYKTERFVVLLNKPMKPVTTSQSASSDIINQDSENQIALFVAPVAKIPLLLRGYTFAEPEGSTSTHRTFIWIVGLTVSLVSLGALRAFEFLDWLSKSTLGKETPVAGLQHNPIQNGVPWSVELTAYPDSSVLNPRTNSSKSCTQTDEYLPASLNSPTAYCGKSTSTNNVHGPAYWTTTSNRVEKTETNVFDPLASLFYQSPLHTVNASLNCPHFSQGINQLCLICWLNSPEQWVFGPSLGPLDRRIFVCLDKLANMASVTRSSEAASGLRCASALLTQSSDGKTDLVFGPASPSRTASRHVKLRVAHASSSTPCPDVTQTAIPPRKRVSSFDKHDRVSPAQSFSKIARSSGDGAPSASPSDAFSPSSFKSEIPSKTSLQTVLPTSPFVDAFQNSASRPVFYIHHSNVDTSPVSSPTLPQRLTPASTEQLRLSANRVLSKALELLGYKTSATPINSKPNSGSPSSSSRKVVLSRVGTSRSGSADSRLAGSHDSLQSLFSDGFEYDEIYPTNSHWMGSCRNLPLLDPEEEERLQQEEEAQLMHLLSTLTSLLDRKVGEASLVEPAQLPVDPTTTTTALTKETHPNQGQSSIPFSDLFQSASDITEDLQHLEEVLDKLRYKLQANQIELEQAEDKLDYAWHLHDHLDASDASSISYDYNSDGSCASLDSEFATRNPTTIDSSVALESPVVMDTAIDGAVRTNPQIFRNSQVLGLTDLPGPESLCTSFTSHYTTTTAMSTERDQSSQSVTDSACGQSTSTYAHAMTTSVPDARFTYEPYFLEASLVPGSITLDRPRDRVRSHSRWSFASHRRSTCHADRAAKMVDSDPSSDLEDPVDPDGFLHPEMTFDKDGTIDWSESGEAIR